MVELLVVIAIILALAGVLVPVGQRMLGRTHTLNCSKNLRQIGMAAMMYAGDNSFSLPQSVHQRRAGGVSWSVSLQPYSGTKLTFLCEQEPNATRPYSYVINDFLTPNPAGAPQLDFSRLSSLEQPHATVMFAEVAPTYTGADHFHFSAYAGTPMPVEAFRNQVDVGRHQGRANYLFADGHVETLSAADIALRLSQSNKPFIDPTLRPE